MAAFTWNVSANPNEDVQPNVSNIKFGDGYTQRLKKGINTMPSMWIVNFQNRSETEATEVFNFFVARGGTEYFEWTPPGQSIAKKFVCQKWGRVVHNGGLYSISATFEEVFDP